MVKLDPFLIGEDGQIYGKQEGWMVTKYIPPSKARDKSSDHILATNNTAQCCLQFNYSRTSTARTLMARLPRLFRTHS